MCRPQLFYIVYGLIFFKAFHQEKMYAHTSTEQLGNKDCKERMKELLRKPEVLYCVTKAEENWVIYLSALVSCDCCNKLAETGGFKQQKYIIPQSWTLEV